MKIYPSFYLVLATFAHVTVEDAGEWSNSEYKKDPKDFRLKNQEQLKPYEMNYKSKFSENRRDSRKDKMKETQRSLYNKRHNSPPSTERNSQESDRNDLPPKSHDGGLKKAWKRNMPIRRPVREPVRMGKRIFADRKKKNNRKIPLRVFGIRQKKKSFVSRKADAVEMYRQLLMKSGHIQKFRTLGKTQQIEFLRNLLRANRNANREKPTENSLQPWKTTTQATMKSSYSIEPSKTPLDLRRELPSSKYKNANHYRLVGNHGRHIPKPPVVFANKAVHKKNLDNKFQGKETRADSIGRQESSLENIQNRHQKPTSPLATASLSSRINRNSNAFMLTKNSDSIHYRVPMRKNVFPSMKYKNELSYNKQKKGNPRLIRRNEPETKKGVDEDESKEEKSKDDKGNNEQGNDDLEQKEKANKDDKETPEKSYRNRNRRRKMNFRFPVNMKMEMRLDNRRPMLRNRKYGFTRPSLFHNEARNFERRRKTHMPSTVIPLRVYRKEDKGRLFESTRNIPKRSDLRDNIVQPPEFVMIQHDNTKGVHSARKDDQDSSEDSSDSKKKDKMHKYHSLPPPGMMDSFNMAGDFQYGHRPVTYTMPRPLYGRPDYYDQLPFVDVPGGKTRAQTSEENTSSENDQRDQQDYNDDNDAPSYTDMQGSDMTVGGDRTIDVHTFYDNNPMYMIPDQKPDDDDDASVENGHDDADAEHTNGRQDSGSEEQDSPKHFQQTIHKNHDSPDTLLIVLDNQAKAKKKFNDRNQNLNYKRMLSENKKVNPVIKADHSYSSGILVLLDNQKKLKQNNANIHPALELSSNGKQKKTLNQKQFYNYTTRAKLKERLTVDIQNGPREHGRSRINRPPKRTSDSFRKSYNNLQHQGRKSALDNLLIELGTKENIFNIRPSNNGMKPSYHARISASKSLQEDRRHDVQANNSSNSTDMERVKEIVANEHRNFNSNGVHERMNPSSPIEKSFMNTDTIADRALNLRPDTEHFSNHIKEVVSYPRSKNNEVIEEDHNGNKTADIVDHFANRPFESNSSLQNSERNERPTGIASKSFQMRVFYPRMHIISGKTTTDEKGKYSPKYPGRKHKQISPAYQRGGVDYVYGPLNGMTKHISSLGDEGEKGDESEEEMSPDGVAMYSAVDSPPSDKLTPIYPSQLHNIYDYGNMYVHTADDDEQEGDDDDNDINENQIVNAEPWAMPERPHKLEYAEGPRDHNPHLTRGRGDNHKSVIKGLHSTHIPESLVRPSNSATEAKPKTKDESMDNLNPYYPNFNHLKSIIDLPPDNMEDYHGKNTDYVNDGGDDDTEEEYDDDDDDADGINRHFIESVYPTDVIDHHHVMSNVHGDFQTPFYEFSHDHEDGHSSQEAVDTGDEEATHFHDVIHSRYNDNARDLHETVAGINGNATTHLRSLEEHRNPAYMPMRTLYNKHTNNREEILESFEDSPADSNSMGEEVAYIDTKYKFPNLNVHKGVLSDHGEHFKSLDNQFRRGIYVRNVPKKASFPSGLYEIDRKKSLKLSRKEKVSDEENARSLEDALSDQEFYATSFGKKKTIRGVQYKNRKDSLKFLRGPYRKFPVHFSRIYQIMNNGKNSLTHSKLYKRLKQIHESKSRPRISDFGRSQNGSKSNIPSKDRQQNINNDSGNLTFFYHEEYPPKGSNSYVVLPRIQTVDSEESRSDRSSNEHSSDDLRDDTVVTSEGIYYKGRRQHGEHGGTFESRHEVKRQNETESDSLNGTSEFSNGDGDKQGLRVDIGTRVSFNESVDLEVLDGKLNASRHMGSYQEGIDVPPTSENKDGLSSQYDSDSISLEHHGSEQAEFHDYIGKRREKTEGFEDMLGTPESKLPNINSGSSYHDIYGTPESDLQKEVHYENYPDNVYSDYDYIGGTAVSQLSQGESMLHGASGALPDGVLTRQETIYSENHYPHPQQHNFMKDNGDGLFKYGEEIVDLNSGTEKRSRSDVESQRGSYLSNDGVGKMEPDPQHYPDGRHEDIRKLALDKKLSNDKFHESRTGKVEGGQPESADRFGREKNNMYDGVGVNYEPRYFASGNGAYFDETHLNSNLFESFPDDTTSGSIQLSPSATLSRHLETTSPTVRKEKIEIPKIERLPDIKRTLIHNKDFMGSAISEGGIIKSNNGVNIHDATINLGTPSQFYDSVKNGYESVLGEDKNITFRSSVPNVNQSMKLEKENRVIQGNYGRGWHSYDVQIPKSGEKKHSSADKIQTSDFRSLVISKENKDNLNSPIVKAEGHQTAILGSDVTIFHDTETEGVRNQSIRSNATENGSSAIRTKLFPDKVEHNVDVLSVNNSNVDHYSNLRGKGTTRQENNTRDFARQFRTKVTNWGRSGHSITHKVTEIFERDGPKTNRVRNEDNTKSITRKPKIGVSKQDQKFVQLEPGIQLNKNEFEERDPTAADDSFQNIFPDILHNGESDLLQRQILFTTTKTPESVDADWKKRSTNEFVNPTPSLTEQTFLSGPEINPIKFSDRSQSFETEKNLIRDLTHYGVPESLDSYPKSLNNRPTISLSSITDAGSQTNENTLPGDSVGVNVSELEPSLYSNNYNVLVELPNSDIVKLSHLEGGSSPSFQPPSVTSDRVANAEHFSVGHLKSETRPLFNLFDNSLPDDNQSLISETIPFQNAGMIGPSSSFMNIDDNASLSRIAPFYSHSTPELSQSQTVVDNNYNGEKTLMGNNGFTEELTVSGLPVDNKETNWHISLGNDISHMGESSSWYTQPKLTNVAGANGKLDTDAIFRLAQTNEPGLSEVSHLNINNLSEITKEYTPTNSDVMSGISDFNELGSLSGISINHDPTDIFEKQFTSDSEFPVSFQSPDLLQNHGIMDKDVMHSLSPEKELSSSHSLLDAFPKIDEKNVHGIGDIYPSERSQQSLPGDNRYFRQLDGGPGVIQIESQPTTVLSLTGKHPDFQTDSGDSKVDLHSFMGISRGDIATDLRTVPNVAKTSNPNPNVAKTSTLTNKDNIHGIRDGNDPMNAEILSRVLQSDTVNMDTLAGISHSLATANRDLLIGKSHGGDPYIVDSSHRTASGVTDSLTETVHESDPINMNTQESGISVSNPAGMDPITRLSDTIDPAKIDELVDIPFSTNPRDTDSIMGLALNNNDLTRGSYPDSVDTRLTVISHSKNPVDMNIGMGISHIDYSTGSDMLSGRWENKDLTLPQTLGTASHSINTPGADKLSTMFQVSDRLDRGQLSGALFTNDQTETRASHTIDTEATRNQGGPSKSDTLTGRLYIGTPIDSKSSFPISTSDDKTGVDVLGLGLGLPTSSYVGVETRIHEITPKHEPLQTLTDLVNTGQSDSRLIINRSQTDIHTLERINTSNPDFLSIPTGSQYSIPTDTMWDINETALLNSLPEISDRNSPSNIDSLILSSDPQELPTLHETFSSWNLSNLHNDTVHSSGTKRIDTIGDFRDRMAAYTDGIHDTDLPGRKDIFLTEGDTHLPTDEHHNLYRSRMDGLSQVIDSTLSRTSDPSRKDRIDYVPTDDLYSADPTTMNKMDHISDIAQLQTDFFPSKDPLGLEGMTHVSGLSHSQTYSDYGNDPTGMEGLTHIQDPTNLSFNKVNHSDMTEKTLSPETSQSGGPSDLPDPFAGSSHSSDRLLSPIDPSKIDGLTGVPLSSDLFTLPRISYSDPFLDLHTLTDKRLLTLPSNEIQPSIDEPYVQTNKDTLSTLSHGDELRQKQTLFGIHNTGTQTEFHTAHHTPLIGDQTDRLSLPETSYIGGHSDGKISQSPSSHADTRSILSSELSFIDGLTAVETMPKLSLSDLQTDALPQLSHSEGLALSKMLDTVGLTGGLTLPGAPETKSLTDQHSITHSHTGFDLSSTQGEYTGRDKVDRFVTGISSRKPIDVGFGSSFQSSWHDLFLNHSRGFNFDAPFDMEQIHETPNMNESSLVDTTPEESLTDGVDTGPSGSSHFVLGDQKFSLNSFLGGTRTKTSDSPKIREPYSKDPPSWAARSFSSSVDSNQGRKDFRTLLDLPSTFLFGQLVNDSLGSTNLDFTEKSKIIPLTEGSINGETQDSTIEIKNVTSIRDKEGWTSPQNLTLLPRVMKTTPIISDMSAPFDLSSLFRFSTQTRKIKPERTTSKVTAPEKRPIFLTIQSMRGSNPPLDLDPDLIPVVQHASTIRVPTNYDVSADITPAVSSSDVSQTSTRTRKKIFSSTHTFPSSLPKENTADQFSVDDGFATDNVSLPKLSSVASQNTMDSRSSFSDTMLALYKPDDPDTRISNRSLQEINESHSLNYTTGFTNPFVGSTQIGSETIKSETEGGISSLQNSSNLVSAQNESQYFHTGLPLRRDNDTTEITQQTDQIPVTNFPTMIEDFDKTHLLSFHIPEDQNVSREFEESFTPPFTTTTDRPTEKTFWWMSSTSDSPDRKSSLMSFTLPESTFIHSVAPKICTDCINHIWEDRQSFMLGMHEVVDFKNITFQRDPDASYYLVESTYEVIRSLNLNLVQRQICKCLLLKEPIQKIQVLCDQQMHGRLIHVELPNKRRDREMQCRLSVYNGTWQGFKSCKEGQKYCDHMFGTRFGECTYALGRNELLKYYSMCNTVLCREAGAMKQWKKDACDVLDALAHECELAGIKVAWREVTKCYKQCPENMEFKTNVSVCRRTCSNFDVGFSCPTSQTESRCDCQEGFVLSQETCIPTQECGCTYQSHYINIGETLSLPGCKKLVTCIPDGKGWSQIKLIEIPGCRARQSCQMVNGSFGCIVRCGGEVCHENATCEEDKCRCNAGLYGDGITTCLSTNDTCTCFVSGLSRYRTYDGQMLNYVATCPMELTRTLDKSNPSILAVYGTTLYNSEQMMMFGTRRYRTVNITLNGLNIYMDTIGDIYVDEVKTTLPFQNFKHNVSAGSSDGWTTVCSGDGVYVSYDRKHRVKIFLPKTYREKLTGMCGNCNGETKDDFYEKHKQKVSTVELVGASYMLNSTFTCGQVSSINKCPEGVERCEIMRSGPFAGCHPYLDPGLAEAYYESCMQMTCAFKAHKDYLKKLTCAALESLDTECMSRGYIVEWRSQSLCSISCCRPMVYNRYINVSDANCVSSSSSLPVCPAQPVDGCVCGEGYVLDNNKCVLPQDCGCWHNNSTYIQLGETYHVPGCHLMIQCRKVATGKKKLVVTHLEDGCGRNSKCVLKDHKHQCVCEKGFARNKNDTICQKIPECGDHPVDVVFVVDTSGSINITGLNSTKHFLSHFINSTNIGPNNMQISILLFNDKPHNLFQLNKYSEKQQMLTALHKIGPPEGTTYLGRALVFVALVSLQEKMGARENVNRAVIILTDGVLHDAERAERWSALLRRQKQAELFTIGVGEADPAQLQRLTRNKNNVFYVREYEKLNSIMDNLLQGVCK